MRAEKLGERLHLYTQKDGYLLVWKDLEQVIYFCHVSREGNVQIREAGSLHFLL